MARLTVRRDERGATAILTAILALVLLGFGALAVDLGQAYAKKSLLQTDVDLAVMAAAAELDGPGACSSEVVAKAEEFLLRSENAVPGQYTIDLTGAPGDQDGYIRCSNWKVELWAPQSKVELGLGTVLTDEDSFDVASNAAAQIKSPARTASLPFFAASGCDYGPQSIRNDSGPSTTEPPVPTLDPDTTDHNNAKFSITPNSTATGTTSVQITLDGTGLKDATEVGFTGAAGPPYHHTVLAAQFVSSGPKTITVNVPYEVLAVDDNWWVRVMVDGKWSEQADAQRFLVGNDKLYCDASQEGNFGTIDIPRWDPKDVWLEWNMIYGIEPELAVHPSPNGTCDGDPGSVEYKNSPVDGTNCVLTEPGLKMAATNDGLIQGKDGEPGRLDTDSTSNCGRNGTNDRTPTAIKGKQINDDLLTCFIINGAHISDLVDGNAVGTGALSADIFKSPRFFWVPVLDTDPSTGAKWWPIIDFRPGFITDQAVTATHDAPGSVGAFNGLEEEPSGIRSVDVILFDQLALPEFAPATGGETDYTGSGTKVIVLVK